MKNWTTFNKHLKESSIGELESELTEENIIFGQTLQTYSTIKNAYNDCLARTLEQEQMVIMITKEIKLRK